MQVDQAKARAVIESLRRQADAIAAFIGDSDALHAELVRQASQGTRSGKPAPGYRPLIDVHAPLMDRHKAVYAAAARQLHHAADVLEAAAAAAAAADADAAVAISRAWDDAGWTGDTAGGGLPSGAGWWQAQAAGASPAGVRFRAESDPAATGAPPLRWTTGGEPVEPATRFRPPRQVVGEERPATVDLRPLRQVAGEEGPVRE
ncbi:hypothetical protein CSPHI_08400 [Corynebacterium sphenisci DSM 44792]|uniref:Uncharacterized protein n=2 Tax=Corynebacterium sphenisci TaxID=191493 RepID=A0A1L7CYZ3_9CORY|nr:hypothetical protein CSPHI_08400 [Corynebacterium sphenisci DSM 44792]